MIEIPILYLVVLVVLASAGLIVLLSWIAKPQQKHLPQSGVSRRGFWLETKGSHETNPFVRQDMERFQKMRESMRTTSASEEGIRHE